MRNSNIAIIVAIIICIGVFIFAWNMANNKPDVQDNTVPVAGQDVGTENGSVLGCYVGGTSQDIYTLRVEQQNGQQVTGRLSFKNYQKDSSSGAFEGEYQDGILFGDYAFQSEGMDSVMEVAFKKVGDSFVRGYGDMTGEAKFADADKITYDETSPLNVFKKTECVN